ncbi:ER-golgi trafficking TRAPP I complex 85 kDa subunit-domain-containing protein [Scheffersomyces xylosifermentans]|uniref:ER-golgi trafficking TRAPP I complex 85 kDa subunit-domain-containing protein n=1 Tax=Scheffersomyces xylosifermentans TaxID=1304137 RepID=UPI00315CC88E
MDYPSGLDPYTARQHLLHHTFSPLISIQSSHNADVFFQRVLGNENISTSQVFRPYGNNAKYTVPNQSFKIINNQLITKNYPSFPVRFEPSLPELLSIIHASSSDNSNGITNVYSNSSNTTTASSNFASTGMAGSPVSSISSAVTTVSQIGANSSSSSTQLRQLFSISNLELLLRHTAKDENITDKGLTLAFFNKVITSNRIVPFETFNHPISQVFVIDYENDTIESLRKLIVEFRNFNFPKFFQIDDLLIHVFVLFDSNKVPSSDIIAFQNKIRSSLNTNSTAIPIVETEDGDKPGNFIKLSIIENSTIDEDLQRISLQESSSESCSYLQIPKSADSIIRIKLYEYINKHLIPHMQAKIRIWDDQMLQPKKSITGRFFSASRKFFNNNNSDSNLSNVTSSSSTGLNSASFNYHENYYYKSTPEQTIRKLADWSLILKDFKYAYSTYDLIKKDYTNDKAWVYVASTQEMCIVSLLLAQTQQVNLNPVQPDKNTLRKIRHDIIEPYIDNLTYTFKSRLNLKTYCLKTLVIVIELLLCICSTFNISWWWNDLIEKYLLKLVGEFDGHLLANGQRPQVIRAILYARLGYCFGKCIFLNDDNRYLIKFDGTTMIHAETEEDEKTKEEKEEGLYHNPYKLRPPLNNGLAGLMRYRKSATWYLLSIREWLPLKNYKQASFLMNNLSLVYNIKDVESDDWYNRSDSLLGFMKRYIKENEVNEKATKSDE